MAWQVTFSLLPLIKILHETLMLRRHYETIAVWDNWDSQFPLTWSGPVCINRAEGLIHPMLSRKWHCGDSGSQFPLILWVRFRSMHKQNGKLSLSHWTLCLPRETKGRDPHRKMSLRSYLVVSAPSAGLSNVYKAKNISIKTKNSCAKCIPLIGDPSPPLSTSHMSRIANKCAMVHWESQTVLFRTNWVSHLLHPVHPIPSHCTMGWSGQTGIVPKCPTCPHCPSHPTVPWDAHSIGSKCIFTQSKSHLCTCIYRVRW